MAVLRAERERLFSETNKVEDAFRANPTPQNKAAYEQAKQVETDWIRKAVKPAQTIWHRTGMAQQGEAPVDVSTFAGLRRAAVDLHGREPTIAEAPKLQKAAKRVQDATTAETRALQKIADATQRGRKTKARTVEELREHLAEKIKKLTPC